MTIRALRHAFCLVLATTLVQALPASADDYTDIWWTEGGAESGSGYNFIQSQDFIFATFFVYGPAPSKAPIWYAGNMSRIANGSFTGGLYQTTGTGIGPPWVPGDYTATQVGNVTFSPTTTTTGTLSYNVGAVSVTKLIARQPLTSIALGGNYFGAAVVYTTSCANPANNGTHVFEADPKVTQNFGGTLQFVLAFNSESCTLQGTYVQEGTLFRIPVASYVCTSGGSTTLNTSATVYEVKATSIGIEGRWNAPSIGGGCVEDGSFSAVFP